MKSRKTIYLIRIALFSAIAFIIALVSFPVIFLPSFYKLDLSESITLIAGFSLGPLGGFLTELIKTILRVILKGSLTAGIGELANFMIGIALIVPAAVIYKKKRTFKGAILGMILGTLCFVAASVILNYFVLFPLYMKVFDISGAQFINMARAVGLNMQDMKSIILFATIPFNILKSVLSCLLAVLLYKRLSGMINKISSD